MTMDIKEKRRLLEKAYKRAAVNKDKDYEIVSIEHHESKIRQKITEDMMNPLNRLHGMYYFKLLDEATHLAASTAADDKVLVTTTFNVYITRPVSKGWIYAKGELLNMNKSQYITQGILIDEQGNELARATAIFMKSKVDFESLEDGISKYPSSF